MGLVHKAAGERNGRQRKAALPQQVLCERDLVFERPPMRRQACRLLELPRKVTGREPARLAERRERDAVVIAHRQHGLGKL
jgi:hypothetical protein